MKKNSSKLLQKAQISAVRLSNDIFILGIVVL